MAVTMTTNSSPKTTLPGSHPCLNGTPSEEPSEVLSTGMEYIIIFKMNNLNSNFLADLLPFSSSF